MSAATRNDWPDLKLMAQQSAIVHLEQTFDAHHMGNLRQGFIPVDQDQKWFLYFEDDLLHCHRSWSGIKMFTVVFEPTDDGAVARFARVNLDPEQYGGTLDEARETLRDVLRYFSTDEAHAPYESGFVTALKEAAKPNYLGKPAVVFELLGDLFQRTVTKALAPYAPDLPNVTHRDVLAANQHVCAVLCGQVPGYHGLEDWRTEKGLGAAVIAACGLDASWYVDENLNCILSEGLTCVTLHIGEIVHAWLDDDAPDADALIEALRDLQGFVTSVLMGTHTLLHPEIRLADFIWEPGEVVVDEEDEPEAPVDALLRRLREGALTEAEDDDHNPEDDEDGGEQESSAAALTVAQGSSFEELLRELRAMEGVDADEEDHNPEDDEEVEEDEVLQPGPPVHPRRDENGKVVTLKEPSTPTAQWTWADAGSAAVVIPDGPMPTALAGLPFTHWHDAPRSAAGWEALADAGRVVEPAFTLPKGKKAAAGVAVLEGDGRIWLVAPSNAYGGYLVTLPKGTQDPGMSLQATALREAFEEAGLAVVLTGHLVDVLRSTSLTRYYLARRVGGQPADMGWESQAVMLAPMEALPELLTHKNDQPILQALEAL